MGSHKVFTQEESKRAEMQHCYKVAEFCSKNNDSTLTEVFSAVGYELQCELNEAVDLLNQLLPKAYPVELTTAVSKWLERNDA